MGRVALGLLVGGLLGAMLVSWLATDDRVGTFLEYVIALFVALWLIGA
jgi:hypothetical protein